MSQIPVNGFPIRAGRFAAAFHGLTFSGRLLLPLPLGRKLKMGNSDRDSDRDISTALDGKRDSPIPLPFVDLKNRFQFMRKQRKLAMAIPPPEKPLPPGLRRFYWKIQILTYSVNHTNGPKDEFHPIIFYPIDSKRINFDMVVVGLQELYCSSFYTLTHLIYQPSVPWFEVFKTFYASRGFARLTFNKSSVPRLVGTALMVFVKRELLKYIRAAEIKYISTAMNGFSGKNGAICMRLTIGDGVHVTLINSHFTPDEEASNYRIWEYKRITDLCDFCQPDPLIKDDYVFWFGNMSWSMMNIEKDRLMDLIQFRCFPRLMDFDELTILRNSGIAFSEYEEAQVAFLPTYRYVMCTPSFDVSYLPAYCDRILFRSSPSSMVHSTFELEVFNMTYETFMAVSCSNHKPVLGSYACTYYLDEKWKPPIEFLSPSRIKGTCWVSDKSNICSYRYDAQYRCAMFDWIGIFHLKFADDWDTLAFSYIVTAFQDKSVSGPRVQSILFPSCAIPTPGTYLLGYFSKRHGCLLALSDPFEVVDKELGMDSSMTYGTGYTAEPELIFHPPSERHLRVEDPRIKEEREATTLTPSISARQSKFKPYMTVPTPMPLLRCVTTKRYNEGTFPNGSRSSSA
uniref:IPPc domain-containing protein n=1 Tax=Trichuris muris TaxID=70415 RepID=A0A5S6QFN2_TRIMR